MRYLPDNNLSYPVLIEIGDTSGSGFYFITDRKFFLVTARHVLYKNSAIDLLKSSRLLLTSYDKDTPITLTVDLTRINIRKSETADISVIELGNINYLEGKNFNIQYFEGVSRSALPNSRIIVVPSDNLKKFNEVLTSNEAFIFGYPTSLGDPNQPQIESRKPLLRKGIIAGKNSKNKTIILDCPVYFGNSGGLAIEVEQIDINNKAFKVIGIVSQFIPFIEELKSQQLGYINKNFENSGYSVVVPIDTIFDLTIEAPTPSETPR